MKTTPVAHTIVNPIFIPTAAAPPPPAPYVVPTMAEPGKIIKTHAMVKRVSEADIEELCAVCLPRLKEKKYPRLDDQAFVTWLRQLIPSGMAFLARSPGAFGLALADHTVLEPRVEVIETFMLGRNKNEMTEIYRAMKRWCVEIGAIRLTIGNCSDANLPKVVEAMRFDREEVLQVLTISPP